MAAGGSCDCSDIPGFWLYKCSYIRYYLTW